MNVWWLYLNDKNTKIKGVNEMNIDDYKIFKCLSLKQPYAELVASGKKTIELRRWNTKYRGEFLIHAAKTFDVEDVARFNLSRIDTGVFIGKATIYDVKHYENEEEWKADKDKHLAGDDLRWGMNGFLIKDAMKFEKTIPFSGALMFFRVLFDEKNMSVLPFVTNRSK